MIYGNDEKEAQMDLLYNRTEEDTKKLTEALSILRAREKGIVGSKNMDPEYFLKNIYANVYNRKIKGEELRSDAYSESIGEETIELVTAIAERQEPEHSEGKTRVARVAEDILDFCNNYYDTIEKKEDRIDVIENFTENWMKYTCSKEDSREKGEQHKQDNAITNNEKLQEFLKEIRNPRRSKKYAEIEKYSQLQKVSATEFAKPKGMFLKKLIEKNLYLRQEKEDKEKLYIITDNSGSMWATKGLRDQLISTIYSLCRDLGLKVEHQFFNVCLDEEILKGTSKDIVKKITRTEPCGDDNVGDSTLEKINEITKNKKNYLLVISDGTATFESDEQIEEIEERAKETNTEVKYIFFSKGYKPPAQIKDKFIEVN